MTLKEYRKQIRRVWLPLVGRGQFTSSEYEYTQALFDSKTPVELVLKAIQNCADRARAAGSLIYSLGVISGDLEAMKKKKPDTQVGAQVERDWRKQWMDDLTILIEEESNQEFKTLYSLLLQALPELSEAQARDRWRKIQQTMQEMVK